MERGKSNIVNTKKSERASTESLSLSSSLSSSSSSSESPPAAAPASVPASALPPRPLRTSTLPPLPPRPPPATTAAAYHPNSEAEAVNKKKPISNDNNQQQRNSLNTILPRQIPQDQKKPPPQTSSSGSSDRGLASPDFDFNSSMVFPDSEIHEGLARQTSQRKVNPAGHARRVSWGGKLIEIPEAYKDNSPIPTLGNDNRDGGNDKAARAKVATDIVSAIEATMQNEGIDTSMIINTKYETQHNRDQSSVPAIQPDDLAKMHPMESEASLEILKAIESQDREHHQEDHLHDEEEIEFESVASLFAPANTRLLDNVPEGAERLFQSSNRNLSHAASAADNAMNTSMSENMMASNNKRNDTSPRRSNRGSMDSASSNRNMSQVASVTDHAMNTSMSENMIGGIHRRHDSSPTRGNRGRIDSASQYNESSTIGEATSNRRTSIKSSTSYRTITSTVKGPRPTPTHNYGRRQLRRQETMEERLFSLNQALDAVDTPVASTESTSNYHHGPTSSMDLFNQNLARLFKGGNVNPGNMQGGLDEKEIVPLTQNIVGSSTHHLAIDNNSTSSTDSGDDKNQNGLGIEDAPIDNLSNLAEYNKTPIAGNLQVQFADGGATQKDLSSKLDDNNIEMGILHPTPSNMTSNGFMSSSGSNGRKKRSRFYQFMKKIGLVDDMEFFLKSRTPSILTYLKNLCWLVLGATIFAAVMFYWLENPPIVYDYDESEPSSQNRTCRYSPDIKATTVDVRGASYSWWVLFLFVRLPITFTLARSLEIFWIHYIILEGRWVGSRWVGSCMGPTFTLLTVQAKGWPAILYFWSICNLILLYGKSAFASHWGYWQETFELFNECNSSGMIIASQTNLKIQLIALVLSIIVAVKRLLIGFHQGRKTFLHYAEELGSLMTKILLISEVSNLSLELELEDQDYDDLSDSDNSSNAGDYSNHLYKGKRSTISGIESATEMLTRNIHNEEGAGMDGSQADSSLKTMSTYKTNTTARNKMLISDKDQAFVTGLLSQSQKRRIERLLGSWQEPERGKILTENVSIGAILQFRKSLSKLDSEFPFSCAFGKADTRDSCIQSSQNLYLRLLEKSPDKVFHFNILGLVALRSDSSLDQDKLKSLIKVFRPNRDGLLSLIDFVKSTDIVYKEMKLLRASVRSSQKIDKSFEKIFNVFFYFVIACMALNVLGYDPVAVFLSLSSVVLAFSFMISKASSKYVEGLLFILYRRPYDIGDYIVVQPVDEPANWDGSLQWIVRDINLFTTTVIYAYTNEMATLSNGSIANSRVLNGARSGPAIIYINLKFGVDIGFEKVEIFREALAQYVDKRPREWAKLLKISNRNVQSDKGYVEYVVVLQHANKWQQLNSVTSSRSQIKYFCHELSKQLDMRYKSPPLPVNLRMDNPMGIAAMMEGNTDSGMMLPPPITRMSAESDHIKTLIRDRRM